MNLSRVLDNDLPDLPRGQYEEKRFRFNPATFFREDKTENHHVFLVYNKAGRLQTFTPEQWTLVRMFDGRRSYEQLAAWWQRKYGMRATPDQIRQFAESLDKTNFWAKTPEEESAALMNELMEDRRRVARQKQPLNIARVLVVVYDADKEVTAAYRYLKWVFDPRFVVASLLAIVVMFCLWYVRRDAVFADSALFWDMSSKSLPQVLQFYLIFAIVGFVHECGHAFTGKHFGAEIHRSGLMLVYTIPAFFVNAGEVWVRAGRMARIAVILGGFWFEMMLCCMATLVWWGTPAGTPVHWFAYMLILAGGIMPLVINLNPLAPLDGYLCLCEVLRIQGLREKATFLLSAWVRRHVFRMPVTVPVHPRRRAIGFALFAFFSGLYTYSMSLYLARITYRVAHHFSPMWAFLPALLVGLRLFKSRIEKLVAFCKALYLDKRELMLAHRTKLLFASATLILVLVAPLWHESVRAPFVLEAVNDAVLRAQVPGRVRQVLVTEGETVNAGGPLLRIENAEISADASGAASQLQMATEREHMAMLRYREQGRARSELRQRLQQLQLHQDEQAMLAIDAPISGTVLTPHIADLVGTYVGAGAPLVHLADETLLRARIYLPEADMDTLASITSHALLLAGRVTPIYGQFQGISPADEPVPDGLLPPSNVKGLQPPPYYVATVLLSNNNGTLRTGMTGQAKIFGERRSLVGLVVRPLLEFAGRKIW